MEYTDRIELRKIKTADGIEIPKKRAVINTVTNRVLAIVSPKYKLVQNTELLNAIHPVLNDLKINSMTPNIRIARGGALTFFKFLGDKVQGEIQKGDIVRFGVEFFNSYDGSMPFGFHIIAERLVCTNGLVVPKSITEISVRHTLGANTNEIKNRLQDYFPKVTSSINLWKTWSETKPSESQLERFLNRSSLGMKLSKEFMNKYNNLTPEKQNLWEFYNILTYHITHQLKTRIEDLKPLRQFTSTEKLTNRLANVFAGQEPSIPEAIGN